MPEVVAADPLDAFRVEARGVSARQMAEHVSPRGREYRGVGRHVLEAPLGEPLPVAPQFRDELRRHRHGRGAEAATSCRGR